MENINRHIRKYNYHRKRSLQGFLFVLPCVIVMLLMMVYPLIQTIHFSFSSVKLPFFDTTNVGLKNFIRMSSKNEFGSIWFITLIYTTVSISLRLVLGFAAALIMQRTYRLKGILRVALLVPWVVPSIVAANTWRWIYNADYGLLNSFIQQFAPNFSANWLGSSQTALIAIIITYVWQGFPFIMLMLVAGMQGIPKSYNEAAMVDGANSAQIFFHVTLPSLKDLVVILIVMEVISGFNSFDVIYTMTAGGPGTATELVGLFIYRIAFKNFDLGGASAVSLLLILIMILCFLFYVPISAVGSRKGRKR